MKIFGSIRELVDVVFRRNGKEITIKPGNTSPGENQTFLLPDTDTTADQTLVTTGLTQVLTNKTIDADANTVSNIDNADIKTGANIDRSKLASGAPGEQNHVLINDGSGVMSSEAALDSTRGGTGYSQAGKLSYGSNDVSLFTSGDTSLTLPTTGNVAVREDKLNAFADTSSSELANVITDETGGSLPGAQLVFNKSPVIDTPTIADAVILADQARAVFREALVNGNNQVTVKAQASLAANYTLELPADGGASGNVLTKGVGDLTEWTAPLTFSDVETTEGTFTNKTFDADGTGNILSNVDNDNIKTGANIARNKLASGASGEENHVLINDGSGVMSSEAILSPSRGGTGVGNTGELSYGVNDIFLITSGETTLLLPNNGILTTTGNDLGDFATTSSSALANVMSDETGSGSLVFATSPALTTPTITSSATMLDQAGINFREALGNGIAAATLQGPASLAANYTLELPATAGSAGQVLTKGASNTTEWSSPLTNPMDSAGDLIKGGSGGATVKLDLGAADYVVKANAAGTDTEFGQIVNDSVASSAAIAGTKISPNFGSQNTVTTGASSAGAFYVSVDSLIDGNSTTGQVRIQTGGTPVARFRNSGTLRFLEVTDSTGVFDALQIQTGDGLGSIIRPDRAATNLNLGVRFKPNALTVRGVNNENEDSSFAYNGFVGIGTSTPATRLQVIGTGSTYTNPQNNDVASIGIRHFSTTAGLQTHATLGMMVNAAATSADPFVAFSVDGGAYWAAGVDNSDFDKFKINPSSLVGATENGITISTGGNVGIGTSSPTQRLQVKSGVVESIRNNAEGNATYYKLHRIGVNQIYHDVGRSGGSAADYLIRNESASGVYLPVGGTSWTGTSDVRSKKNIINYEVGLAEIANLRPVRFDYLTDDSEQSERTGFVAQEVVDFVPETVSGDGEDIMYGISLELFVPALVNAIKDLKGEIEELRAEVVKLSSDSPVQEETVDPDSDSPVQEETVDPDSDSPVQE